jgi:outer membrane receptor protein involved in Fe transport
MKTRTFKLFALALLASGFVGGKFTVRNTNIAKIRSRGVELIGALRFTEYLSLLGNYTYTDSEVVEGPFQGNQLVFVAENLFNRQYISNGFGQILGAPRRISGGIRITFGGR